MELALFDYDLPPRLIAQYPSEKRDDSRLLVFYREDGHWEDRSFRDLPTLLRPGDCLVVNESRVIPARLIGRLEADGREVELLLVREVEEKRWEALARPSKRCGLGSVIELADGSARARVERLLPLGKRLVEIEWPGRVETLLKEVGLPPLPPYIRRHRHPGQMDWERYQTVYANVEGSVAAPTAGLHFTEELLSRLREGGVAVVSLTLHVGPGTFRPIRSQEIERHQVESERAHLPPETALAVNRANAGGGRVIAVGTTTTRTLEAASTEGTARPFEGDVGLYIHPGYRFDVVDGLITNFHLPRSSLLVLVSAFAGRERILSAYRHAIEAGYRFYSYGDAMLIL
jgi:S-adenosylmethionine:tRNA ribosyltransferase-isomerase